MQQSAVASSRSQTYRQAVWRRLHSIRFRLTLWFVAILAVVLLIFSAFVYIRQASDLRSQSLDRLTMKTRALETVLRFGADAYFEENRPLTLNSDLKGESLLDDSDILALVSSRGQVIQKTGPITSEDFQQLASLGLSSSQEDNPFSFPVLEATTGGKIIREEYLFVIAPIAYEHQVFGFFILGTPVDPSSQLPRLLITLILGSLATLALALAGGFWLADRAMRPVKTITRTAREIGETDLSRRLHLETQDELGELADTFDGMLDRLEAAFTRQRQFTADASHELRTPLTIVGLETSRALASRRSSQEYERALGVIQSENEFMSRLVNNLLTLSRMDAGQTVLQFEPLDLSDVTLEVVERLSPLAERRKVTLSTGDLPELKIMGDRQYLSQMIANLVENAIKYSQPPQARVHVSTGHDQEAAWMKVEDNGPGIAPEHLPHLFDRFYQVDRARSHNPDELGNSTGTLNGEPGHPSEQSGMAAASSGLGLSIVEWIVRAHHGQVTVHSQVGQGTVFQVNLPLVEDQPPTAPVD